MRRGGRWRSRGSRGLISINYCHSNYLSLFFCRLYRLYLCSPSPSPSRRAEVSAQGLSLAVSASNTAAAVVVVVVVLDVPSASDDASFQV
jgi:hypothetical protein